MHSVQLLSAILKGKWLLDPQFVASQGPVIAKIISRESEFRIDKDIKPDEMLAFAVSGQQPTSARYSWYRGFDNAKPGSVAVISVKGALMKEDQWCGAIGTSSIGQIVKAADSHHNIEAIVLHIDSPGGTVDGTEALANIIKSTKKPVVSYIDGLMASAALWIGTSANEIMASTDTDEIGSVGVLMSFADVQPYYESLGVKFHTITASTSPDKVKMWKELCDGKYDAYIKEVLDPLDEKFMNTVKQNRPDVKDEHLTGKVFFARDVMGVFVDAIGTLDQAITRAYQLAHPDEELDDTNSNKNTSTMEQFEKVNGVLGVESLEASDDHVSLNAEQLGSIETALADGEQAVSDAQAAQATAEEARQTAESALETANTERNTAQTDLENATSAFDAIDETVAAAEGYQAKVEAIRTLLAAKPGAKPEGNLDTEDKNDTPDANQDVIDSLPHNKDVDDNL